MIRRPLSNIFVSSFLLCGVVLQFEVHPIRRGDRAVKLTLPLFMEGLTNLSTGSMVEPVSRLEC